ncbi:protein tyrosine kinase [Nocardia sp. NPDC049190]|uniref:protein tyrosine kinase n=1 Tax=Nocardia sp. NPDC049190 TaxID=3155650 RepID=UPI0033F2B5FB
MGLIDIWHIVRRRWVLIAAIALAGTVAGVWYGSSRVMTYVASSTMYVSMATGTSVNDSYQGGLAAQQRVRSYLELATSAAVAERVVHDQGLTESPDEFRSRITASSPPASTILEIAVSAPTAQQARDFTDVTVAQFRALVDSLESIETGAAPAARVSVVDRARLPAAPAGPGTSRFVAMGLFGGLLLGFAAAFLRERTDRRVRTSSTLADIAPVPVVAAFDHGESPSGAARRLRNHLRGAQTIECTSVTDRSQSKVAHTLALAFADAGHPVILVDADTSGGGSSGTMPGSGLTTLLRGGVPLDRAIIEDWGGTGVAVLPIGQIEPDTSDLIASEHFAHLIADLRKRYHRVVIETAPVSCAPDAVAVAPLSDAILAIADLGKLTEPQLRTALTGFGASGPTGMVGYHVPGSAADRLVGWLRV